MSDSEDDKTRIKRSIDEADKTRLAPNKASAKDPTITQKIIPDDSDKTRIAAKRSAAAARSDQTQFRPAKKNTEETRIKPREPKTLPPVSKTVSSDQSKKISKFSVLKDRFILEDVLGSGGMGIVYKAKDMLKVEAKDRDPYVAIKVLNDEFKSHPEAFIALQREARKSQRIAHPNIVSVFDFDRDEDIIFMTMEHMEGKPLDVLIRQYQSTGLPTDDAWELLKGICSALMYAHKENIIHSDFKPGNVFVTTRGIAKVFDFGIARAVSQAETREATTDDRTLFDAGNLGALTPAYASLEMLLGETPDARDDVYALGCVAYELFTGEHPFHKVPADEARQQGLKPRRIKSLTKKQWRAIERALAFERDDRIGSVEEFLHELTTKYTPSSRLGTILALSLSVMIAVYFLYIKAAPEMLNEDDMRNSLEFEIRLDLHKVALAKLLEELSFTEPWEGSVWLETQELRKLLKPDDVWLQSTEHTIYTHYMTRIVESRTAGKLDRAKTLIANAYRYTKDTDELENEKLLLAEAVKNQELRAKEQNKTRSAEYAQAEKSQVVTAAATESFNTALNNVQQQLRCQARLNMRNIDTAIKKLQDIDTARYNKEKPRLVAAMVACINQIAATYPDKAEESKKYALNIFDNHPAIVAITIAARDPCDLSIAGLGARGERAVCRDLIKDVGDGPSLVVVPANRNIAAFAIGKYEVSVADMNIYCKQSGECDQMSGVDKSMPATRISLERVKSYLKWLSKKTNRKYRLPTKAEWQYAANASKNQLDPNRNCQLSSRGIQKGNELVSITTGKQNDWGMVNYVGNAQEIVYDKGSKLVVVGGSYNVSMDKCSTSYQETHVVNGDAYTGFRVLRELKL